MDKSVLRKQILNKRQALSEVKWQTKSKLICDRLISLSLFTQSDTIFAYFSFRKEADLFSLFSLNKKWAFPRCVDKCLIWHLWQPGEVLIKEKYGIQTPLEAAPIDIQFFSRPHSCSYCRLRSTEISFGLWWRLL